MGDGLWAAVRPICCRAACEYRPEDWALTAGCGWELWVCGGISTHACCSTLGLCTSVSIGGAVGPTLCRLERGWSHATSSAMRLREYIVVGAV